MLITSCITYLISLRHGLRNCLHYVIAYVTVMHYVCRRHGKPGRPAGLTSAASRPRMTWPPRRRSPPVTGCLRWMTTVISCLHRLMAVKCCLRRLLTVRIFMPYRFTISVLILFAIDYYKRLYLVDLRRSPEFQPDPRHCASLNRISNVEIVNELASA